MAEYATIFRGVDCDFCEEGDPNFIELIGEPNASRETLFECMSNCGWIRIGKKWKCPECSGVEGYFTSPKKHYEEVHFIPNKEGM